MEHPEGNTTNANANNAEAPTAGAAVALPASRTRRDMPRRPRRGEGKRTPRRSREAVRPEFDQKTLLVRRVARVVAGGRRFNFSVALVLGNRKGAVGVGVGKAADTSLAIEKATKDARKNLLTVPRFGGKTLSIPRRLEAKYASARLFMIPAPNKGLIAGSAARTVLELGGITDVNAKILSGSKNKLNIARAALQALSSIAVESEAQNTASRANSLEKD